MGRDVYILQATLDTRPEDLLVTPVIEGEGSLRYVASPLVTAMIRGGIAILDEGNRMSEKSWASLAPLLDNRRYVESIVAGIKIKAHPQFRLVATMNDDASTFELPEYIHSRLQPQIFIDFPERDEEYHILKENLPFAEERILQLRDRFPAAGARRRRALHRARRHQRRPLRHQAEEPGHRAHARNRGARNCSWFRCWEKKRYAMPGELDLPLPDPGSLKRGRFTYFPVVPGRLEFAIEVRAGHPARPARSGRARTARHAAAMPGCAPWRGCRRCRVIFYPDEGDRRRPGHLRSRRAGRPVHRGHPHGPRNRRRNRLRRSRRRDSARTSRTPTPTRTRSATSAWPATSRPTASTRSRAREELARHAAGIAWKLQGTDPAARASWWCVSLNLLDPVLDAMEEPQAQPMARVRREGVELLNPHPESLAEITAEYPAAAVALREVPPAA